MCAMPDKHFLIRELKNLLHSCFGSMIQDVILFGSQAAGKAHEDSDYDVLIVVSQDYDWKFRDRISDVVYDLELKYADYAQ
jgi:predicted nucleotidyltransferase